MKTRTFYGYGKTITTSDKEEIKRLKACGYQERKEVKQYFAKGLNERNFF